MPETSSREGAPRLARESDLLKILIVDDDPKFRRFVAIGLAECGHLCATAADGPEALRRLETESRFDLILLDVMLPEMSGWDLLDELRRHGREVPVVFVTARDAVEERVKGLRMGADDYVIKPFAFQELVARIEAVIRRRRSLEPIQLGDLTIDLAARRVQRAGEMVDVSPREFDVLMALVQAHGRVLSRAELLDRVWGITFEPGTNVVEVHVARLRAKLHAGRTAILHTKRGEGYYLSEGEEPA
jgi:two-component system copper resistance phosphate regulon response regulator CusR